MRVLVGSKNPVKIEATNEAFSKYFSEVVVDSFKVFSNVSAQPIAEDTFVGAKNRALELKMMNEREGLMSDFFVGIEGGIIDFYSKWFVLGVSCVSDTQGKLAYGVSPCFELPKSVYEQISSGKELGQIMEVLSGQKNIGQREGAIGFFSKGVMDRKALYTHSLIVALVPLLNQEIYF